MDIIFLKPVFKEKIWGGSKLKREFDYGIPSENTGECWAISAHENGDCEIANGEFKGKTLGWLYKNHRALFGNIQNDKFPLLVKILDAKEKLSVQVHPNDEYAWKFENGEYGKTECWYILDCKKDGDLILGHNANNKKEMKDMINSNNWDKFIRTIKINKGDFFYIPTGTIHAICEDTLILEIQQSSDTTYRVYDYDRLQNGEPRELHIDKSIDVTTVPHKDYDTFLARNKCDNAVIDTLVEEEYFSVYRYSVDGKESFTHKKPFIMGSVISGDGYINDSKISKGMHFILPGTVQEFTIQGNIEIIISSM